MQRVGVNFSITGTKIRDNIFLISEKAFENIQINLKYLITECKVWKMRGKIEYNLMTSFQGTPNQGLIKFVQFYCRQLGVRLFLYELYSPRLEANLYRGVMFCKTFPYFLSCSIYYYFCATRMSCKWGYSYSFY